MPWKIFDHRRQHELAACFVPFDEQRLKIGARRVQGGRQPAGPEPMMMTLRRGMGDW